MKGIGKGLDSDMATTPNHLQILERTFISYLRNILRMVFSLIRDVQHDMIVTLAQMRCCM